MKRTSCLVVAVLLPAAVLAQANPIPRVKQSLRQAEAAAADRLQKGEAPDRAPGAAEQEGREGPGPAEGTATTADRGLGPVNAPDTYTVRPGDTLWDLSGRFLNNPWYWPKVWSYNPDISNPHWIEPGNVLRFYRSSEEAPARVEAVAEAGAPEEPSVEGPREMEDFSRADMRAALSAEDQDEVAVAGPNRIGFVGPRTAQIRRETFVTPREVEESGALVAAASEKTLLTTLDRAYARFKNGVPSKVGESYLVYRTIRPIDHPVTRQRLGYQAQIVGTAKVVAVDPKAATVLLGQCIEPVERGDLLGPWTDKLVRPIAPKPNARSMTGAIVAAQIDTVTQVGEQHLVFVNRGKVDGVEEGNVFGVVRSGDPTGRAISEIVDDRSLPEEVIGSLLVVDVKEHVSTALVTRSLRELLIGDRVEMRAAGGGGGTY